MEEITGGQDCAAPQAERLIPTPTANVRLSWKNVEINKVANGFIVKVGCQTFVEKEWQAVVEGLDLYWRNPYEAEKKFCK